MIICSMCQEPVRGGSLIDPHNIGQVAALLFLHMVDRHWDLVERIRATSNKPPAARMGLVAELAEELTAGG